MRSIRITLSILLVAALLVVSTGPAGAETHKEMKTARVGEKAPDFTLMDAHGKKHSLSEYAGKFVVLEWVNFGCPFVKKHYNSGNMQQLQEAYTEKGVVWLSICSSAPGNQGYFAGEELVAEISGHKSHATAYLIDESGEVGHAYEAKTTPNMYVVDPEGVLVYAGAIDDTPSVNPDDIPKSMNYVDAALKASMAGKVVKVSTTQPYGCGVKYAKK